MHLKPPHLRREVKQELSGDRAATLAHVHLNMTRMERKNVHIHTEKKITVCIVTDVLTQTLKPEHETTNIPDEHL